MSTRTSCRVCESKIESFMSFGQMPIANGFIQESQFSEEYFFELAPAFCENCLALQLVEQPHPEQMFHENYAFFSRQSKHMIDHFKTYAHYVEKNFLKDKNDLVVEIGSNDGIMIENFYKKGFKHLGVDPSRNVAQVAAERGIHTKVCFFNRDTSDEIKQEFGNAAAIISANVMCHLPDLNDVAFAAYDLLTDDGVLIFEDPYLGDMLSKVSYDQLYDEHVYIFSALSVENIFGRSGFEIIDLLPQNTHGGSMRYVLAKKGRRPVSKNVYEIKEKEKLMNINQYSTYIDFKKNCEHSKNRIRSILEAESEAGKSVAGYGATSKSTTILNYCNIGPDLLAFISDTTPIKQNKFTPGMHIPVKSYEYFCENLTDKVMIFAWNHASEILEKEKDKISKNQWITHLPFHDPF